MNREVLYQFHDFEPKLADFEAEVIDGLTQSPKSLPCKFFYDERGSQLFHEICNLPEYYPTRTELSLLQQHGEEIGQLLGRCVLIEFGSGSNQKIRALLENIEAVAYMPVDISREFLLQSSIELATEFDDLDVMPVCADYAQTLALPNYPPAPKIKRIGFFPGSTIGNFDETEAVAFLQQAAQSVDGLLIGVDLKKDPETLNAAYNDAAGVTAAFNLNLLARINRELSGNFDLTRFTHQAQYNASAGRIEMHLVSECAQIVSVAGKRISFRDGERIHTENSYKYSLSEFAQLAERAGFASEKTWVDEEGLFSVHYLRLV